MDCGFRQDFFIYSPHKMWQPGPAHFWPRWHNLKLEDLKRSPDLFNNVKIGQQC